MKSSRSLSLFSGAVLSMSDESLYTKRRRRKPDKVKPGKGAFLSHLFTRVLNSGKKQLMGDHGFPSLEAFGSRQCARLTWIKRWELQGPM